MVRRPFIEMFHPALIFLAVLLGQARTGQTPTNPQTPAPQAPAQTSTAPAPAPQTPNQAPQAPASGQSQGTNTQSPAPGATASAGEPVNLGAMFVKQMTVTQLGRLAITPNIDGKISPEEWDPFASQGGVDTFFQWEPHKLYFAAAHIPLGQDMIISIDGHGDSWLVGRDNLEVRVHWQGADAQITERMLDNTPMSGPTWVDATNFRECTQFAGTTDSYGHTIEIGITDPETETFPDTAGKTAGIRFDFVPETTPQAEPLLPRVMVPARLQLARGVDVPAGLSWKPEVPERTVVPGESNKIRLTFTGTDDVGLKRIDMRSEGLAQNETDSSGAPFPTFDKKGRAFVDYKTKVQPDAGLGYRVMKATLVDGSGKSSTLETSYEIAPLVTFDFNSKVVQSSTEPQVAKFSAFIRSHTSKRMNGVFHVNAPDGWKVKSGEDVQFLIYDARGSKRQVFELVIPANYKGTAPVKLVADFAGTHSEQTVYVVVE